MEIPDIVFIIPYRDREEHKHFFTRQMEYLLEDIPQEKYRIYFAHQKDNRSFNRGAMKNIGFLAIKETYPDDYKNITFVFHDVDTLPYKKGIVNYYTTENIVKHFYGFNFALGGIFSILGRDFEKTGGFPNFWAWGGEDNIMQKRVDKAGLIIDRSNFFKIGDKNILQFADGYIKLISRDELSTVEDDDSGENLFTIKNLKYGFNNEFIDVYSFTTKNSYNYKKKRFERHNISKGNNKIKIKRKTAKNLQKLVIF